jgi:hypothetical protein
MPRWRRRSLRETSLGLRLINATDRDREERFAPLEAWGAREYQDIAATSSAMPLNAPSEPSHDP